MRQRSSNLDVRYLPECYRAGLLTNRILDVLVPEVVAIILRDMAAR